MRAFLMGFVYAGRGIAKAVREEKNMRFHLCAAVYVLVFSLFYSLSRLEYCMVFIVIFLVFATELANTAVEHIVDKLCPEQNRTAGLAKDVAAGAVLMVCIGAAVCGFLLFWDLRVFAGIFAWFTARPLMLVLFVLSLAASVWFVLGYGAVPQKTDKKEEK